MLELVDHFLRILLTVVLCSIIGIEREKSHKPAGLRTHVLVGLGSAVATVVALKIFPGDASRIVAAIVTGVGFLGAGSIIGSRGNVQGLTTAATIWMSAILGLAVGAGYYEIAIGATALALVILWIKWIEKKI